MTVRIFSRKLWGLSRNLRWTGQRPWSCLCHSRLAVLHQEAAFKANAFSRSVQLRGISFSPALRGEIVQFHLSDIGEGIKEVTVKEWFVKPGDTVAQFDEICEVQSDKASVTITSRFDGVIKKLHYQVDDIAQTGDPLVDIEIQGSQEAIVDVQEAEAIQVSQESSTADVVAGSRNDKKSLATPAVRRLATEHNINLSSIEGTGKDGRVMKEDILKFIENQQSGSQPTPATAQPTSPPPPAAPKATTKAPTSPPLSSAGIPKDTETNFSVFTKAMTKTMTAALEIPHFRYCDEFDVGKLIQVRKELNSMLETTGVKLSFMPFLVKATSIALNEYPILNSSIDVSRGKIITKGSHNIGIAMDTPDGLIVPNIKGVQNLSIVDIAQELARLQDLGQRSKLGSSELKGGTITLSNIGTVGGTYMGPVILPPEVAIGAIGKIQALPRFDDHGNVYKANIINLSWSADHRVIDGATMARFSNVIKRCIENPTAMLMYVR